MPNGLVSQNVFELSSLKGGLDDTTPYMALDPDVCVTAENVEFYRSTLGERRKGCTTISISSALTSVPMDGVTWMYRHLPTNNQGEAELWALAQSLSIDSSVIAKRTTAGWTTVSPDDAFQVLGGQGHRLSAQTLHGKLFIAGKTAQDRLHVYDGTNLRRVGLAQPAAPAVADSAVGGTFATTRYYRVRYVILSGSTVIARSEPSTATTFTPAGTKNGAVITKPASISEHETHWEIEASLDNVDFYRIVRQVVGTTTYTDTQSAASGYTSFTLSDDIGVYTLPPSAKYLSADDDRLLMAGSWEDDSIASRVQWTPVYADPIGGNDERIDLSVDPFIDLDGYEGGEITGLSRNVNGYIYAFKRSHIYKLMRTGQRTAAYEAVPLTKVRGALPGSLVEAVDQSGQPSLYFLDASVGPMRLGANGLQWCGRDIQTLWKRVNVNAVVPCHGIYYNDKRQLHYWLAIDDVDYPNFKIVLHVNEMRDTDEGGRRGWVTVSKGSRIAEAHCSVMFSDNIDDTGDARSYSLVPLIGKQSWVVSGSTITDYIQRCDTGGTDAYTTGDTVATYRGVLTSRPFALSGLLGQFELLTGALLLKAETIPDGAVYIKLIKDFGVEEKVIPATFFTTGTEAYVLAQLNDLSMAEMYTMQISFGDLDDTVDPPETWEADLLHLKITSGNTA